MEIIESRHKMMHRAQGFRTNAVVWQTNAHVCTRWPRTSFQATRISWRFISKTSAKMASEVVVVVVAVVAFVVVVAVVVVVVAVVAVVVVVVVVVVLALTRTRRTHASVAVLHLIGVILLQPCTCSQGSPLLPSWQGPALYLCTGPKKQKVGSACAQGPVPSQISAAPLFFSNSCSFNARSWRKARQEESTTPVAGTASDWLPTAQPKGTCKPRAPQPAAAQDPSRLLATSPHCPPSVIAGHGSALAQHSFARNGGGPRTGPSRRSACHVAIMSGWRRSRLLLAERPPLRGGIKQ